MINAKTAIIALICAFALAMLGYLLFRRTPERYYARARSAHKQGEKCYLGNDFELADEYYTEAEDYRNLARELEKTKNA